MKRFLRLLPVFFFAACNTQAPPTTLPLNLPAEEQISRLDARAGAVVSLKARGTLAMEWTDHDGNHRQTTEAILRLKKVSPPPANPALPEADVLLFGKVSGTDVFEMGVNQSQHWMAFRVDPKEAYVGRVGLIPRGAAADRNTSPFRADRVLEILGLTRFAGQQVTVTPRQTESDSFNDVALYRQTAVGRQYVARIEAVNQRTGDIEEVRIYYPDGTLEADAQLSDYFSTKSDDDAAAGAAPGLKLRLPYRIVIRYPAQQANVDMRITTWRLNPDLPDFAKMPDFANEGLKVIDVDRDSGP